MSTNNNINFLYNGENSGIVEMNNNNRDKNEKYEDYNDEENNDEENNRERK